MTTSIADIIIDLENQTWRALQTNGEAFLPFLSEDFIMLLPLGMKVTMSSTPNVKDVMTSDAFVPWKSYKMSDVIVMPIGLEGANISYKVKAYRPMPHCEDVEFRALISSIWRKEPVGDHWILCFHQQTPYEEEI